MSVVDVHEAKTRPPRPSARVEEGGEIVIARAPLPPGVHAFLRRLMGDERSPETARRRAETMQALDGRRRALEVLIERGAESRGRRMTGRAAGLDLPAPR